MTGHRILRWEIPIDDQDHDVRADGGVLHVAGHRHFRDRVEFWTLAADDPEFWAARIGTVEPVQWPARVFRAARAGGRTGAADGRGGRRRDRGSARFAGRDHPTRRGAGGVGWLTSVRGCRSRSTAS